MEINSQTIILKYTDGTEKRFGLTTGSGSQALQDKALGQEIARTMSSKSDIVRATLRINLATWKNEEDPDNSGYVFSEEEYTYPTKEYGFR